MFFFYNDFKDQQVSAFDAETTSFTIRLALVTARVAKAGLGQATSILAAQRPGVRGVLLSNLLSFSLVTSLAVGAVLGLVVPWVLVRALDLRGLTGGRSQPVLAVDPVLSGVVLGAVVLTVLLAVTASAWLAGRTNLAQALRVGEER